MGSDVVCVLGTHGRFFSLRSDKLITPLRHSTAISESRGRLCSLLCDRARRIFSIIFRANDNLTSDFPSRIADRGLGSIARNLTQFHRSEWESRRWNGTMWMRYHREINLRAWQKKDCEAERNKRDPHNHVHYQVSVNYSQQICDAGKLVHSDIKIN